MKKQEKGITLIALVITIVILLILAGVSLNLVVGNEGILTRGKEAGDKYGKQSENEQQGLNDVEAWVNEQFGVVQKVGVDTKATAKGTINGEAPNANNPVIPKGYIPINSGSATWGDGTNSPDQSSVDQGLVIKDDKNNEWVWVPVDSSTLSSMCVTSADTVALSGNVEVTTNIYSNSITVGKSGDLVTISRNKPSTADYREPDLVASYDNNSNYYKNILNFDTSKAMANAFVSDYVSMVNSIKEYGGFYIGRYELSNEGVQKGKATLTGENWYALYKKCTELNASNAVKARMIYGIQWDLACDFISKKGEQKGIRKSKDWGNYINSTDNAAVTVTENGAEVQKYGSLQVTGYSEFWKANNIYDLAGNCYEWTQEASSSGSRSYRGGHYNYDGGNFPVSSRAVANAGGTGSEIRNSFSFDSRINEAYLRYFKTVQGPKILLNTEMQEPSEVSKLVSDIILERYR